MDFKKIDPKISFAELTLSSSMEKNRSLKTLKQMNKVIYWSYIARSKFYNNTIGSNLYLTSLLFFLFVG